MREAANAERVQRFLEELGRRTRGPGKVYLVGGATAVLFGWRNTTADIDLKLQPEPSGAFEAIADLKNELDVNVELAAPDQFLPPVPGWEARSLSVGRYGGLEVLHYDLVSQALAKLQRAQSRDLLDVQAMLERGLITRTQVWQAYWQIESQLIRYPGVSKQTLVRNLETFLGPRP